MLKKSKPKMKPMHKKKDCKGEYCCFHNPSDHHMKKWPMHVRYDRGGMTERICSHGVGHPDPDSLSWMKRVDRDDDGCHGCDGCCVRPVRRKKKLTLNQRVNKMGKEMFKLRTELKEQKEACDELLKEQVREIQALQKYVDIAQELGTELAEAKKTIDAYKLTNELKDKEYADVMRELDALRKERFR